MTYWPFFEELERLRNEMNKFFSELMKRPLSKTGTELAEGFRQPLMDLVEKNGEVTVITEMPGLNKEDIDVKLTENTLEIKAKKKIEKEEEKGNYRVRERRHVGFYRKITLPEKVDPSTAKATYENGILKITLTKKEIPKKFKIKIE